MLDTNTKNKISTSLTSLSYLASYMNESNAIEFQLPKELANNGEIFVEKNLREEIGLLSTILENLEHKISFNFEYDGIEYRVIEYSKIDEILIEEMNDEEVLPYFDDNFLSIFLGVPEEEIDICQKNNCRNVLLQLAQPHLEEIANGYAIEYGYGHFFGAYDGAEYEFKFWQKDFLIFKVS